MAEQIDVDSLSLDPFVLGCISCAHPINCDVVML